MYICIINPNGTGVFKLSIWGVGGGVYMSTYQIFIEETHLLFNKRGKLNDEELIYMIDNSSSVSKITK